MYDPTIPRFLGSLDNSLLSKAHEVLLMLKKHNIVACVAGGYIRDVLNGRIPKDMDVFILDDSSATMVCNCLRSSGDIVPELYEPETYEGLDRVTDLDYVIKANIGMPVDFIAYDNPPENWEQQLAMFDSTVNMAAMLQDGQIVMLHDVTAKLQYFFAGAADYVTRLPMLQCKYPEKTFVTVEDFAEYKARTGRAA